MPFARRVLLPDSGHAALLESDVRLSDIMDGVGFTDKSRPPFLPQQAGEGASASGGYPEVCFTGAGGGSQPTLDGEGGWPEHVQAGGSLGLGAEIGGVAGRQLGTTETSVHAPPSPRRMPSSLRANPGVSS